MTNSYKFEHNYDSRYRSLYPEGVYLHPSSTKHDMLVDAIMQRAYESERFLSVRHDKWRKLDETLTAYIPLDEYERHLKTLDERKPVSIVVPESFAIKETFITYMMSIFGDGSLYRYIGVGPEDVIGSILLERVVDVQAKRGKALLRQQDRWNDAFTYGFGPAALNWTTKHGKRMVMDDTGFFDPFTGSFIQTGVDRFVEDTTLFEGTMLYPIDPYLYLPDPGVPISEVQQGEYVGWIEHTNYNALLRNEHSSGSYLFNVRYLKDIPSGLSSIYMHNTSGRDIGVSNRTRSSSVTSDVTHKIDVIWMYIDLIPSEWDMGSSDVPEKWLFGLAADSVIIAAHPMNLFHDMFPVTVCAPDFTGHELAPISRVEIMYGYQEIANCLMNTFTYALRKNSKPRMIVDPKSVHLPDFLEDRDIVRTRRTVWGRGVKDIIAPLQISDVTRDNMGNLALVRDMARQHSGAVDSVQGIQRARGERVTAAEFSATRQSALSKLQRAARTIGQQSLYDEALIYALHTQQFMSQDMYVQIAGRWEDVLRQEYGAVDRVPVTPFDINVAFDVDIQDGSVEGPETAENWLTLFQLLLSNPETMQSIDLTRVFLHISRLLKARNAHEFLRKPQIMPDEEVAAQAALGNLAPVESLDVQHT